MVANDDESWHAGIVAQDLDLVGIMLNGSVAWGA